MPIRLAQALEGVERRCNIVTGTETIRVDEARSRFLANDLVAPIAVPPTDNSAVDGYAFRHEDLPDKGWSRFAIVGTSAAGRPFVGRIGPAEAVRILTGAHLPAGGDTIAMQEDVRRDNKDLFIEAGLQRFANVRPIGEDIAEGARVFAAGHRIGPVEIGIMASLGMAHIDVRKPLRVAVASAGDELVERGDPPHHGGIYDSNRPMLLSLLDDLGMAVTDLGILSDRKSDIQTALAQAASGHDVILTSAGVSVGDEDHIRAAVEALGGLDFCGVAIKPGRPILCGHIDGVPFFGMPGNPAAMLIAFLMLVRPGLFRLAGGVISVPQCIPVYADFTMRKRPERREYLRCTLYTASDGLHAQLFLREGAGILSSLSRSDGLLELEEDLTEITPGTILRFIPLTEFGL